MSLSPLERILLQRRLARLQRGRSSLGGLVSVFLLVVAVLPAAALLALIIGCLLYTSPGAAPNAPRR